MWQRVPAVVLFAVQWLWRSALILVPAPLGLLTHHVLINRKKCTMAALKFPVKQNSSGCSEGELLNYLLLC